MMYWLTSKEIAVVLEALEYLKKMNPKYLGETAEQRKQKMEIINKLIANKINS